MNNLELAKIVCDLMGLSFISTVRANKSMFIVTHNGIEKALIVAKKFKWQSKADRINATATAWRISIAA